MAMGTAPSWGVTPHPRYMYSVPMFHCNGWCHVWCMTLMAGTIMCLRAFDPKVVFELLEREKITHFGGAPIMLNMLANAPKADQKIFERKINVMTAGAPPPAKVLEAMVQFNFDVLHVYGLTETYGHILQASPQDNWAEMSIPEQAEIKARQGVRFTMMEETDEALGSGWFVSGDLGVVYPDGYIQLKDRAKDIIISGGENISSVEVENVLYKNAAVGEAAVVAMADEKWGEVPCAFVELKPGQDISEADLIEFCADNMARFKRPKKIVFGPLPKTATGKIQKKVLRERVADLSA